MRPGPHMFLIDTVYFRRNGECDKAVFEASVLFPEDRDLRLCCLHLAACVAQDSALSLELVGVCSKVKPLLTHT